MGTLVEKKSVESLRQQDELRDEGSLNSKKQKKLTKEYNRFRKHIEDMRRAYAAVDNALETDDIYFRLQKLEKASKKLRHKYAKSHRKILKATK